VTRLKGMVRKPGPPTSLKTSLKEMDEAIASGATRKLDTRCLRLSGPFRIPGRRDP